jgi:hypothetical protein
VAVEGKAREETERAGEVMAGHTPGPWQQSGQLILTEANYDYPNPKASPAPKIIGEVHWDYDGDRGGKEHRIKWPEAEANQRLMIAAPELLAALEDITQHAFDDDTPIQDIIADMERMRDIARAAIAKATEPSPVPSV